MIGVAQRRLSFDRDIDAAFGEIWREKPPNLKFCSIFPAGE
jgi:hypothetical protein